MATFLPSTAGPDASTTDRKATGAIERAPTEHVAPQIGSTSGEGTGDQTGLLREQALIAVAPIVAKYKAKQYQDIGKFEQQRTSYFEGDYVKNQLYWQALCDLIRTNLKGNEKAMDYVKKKVEAHRAYAQALYKVHDKVEGGRKGAAQKEVSRKDSGLLAVHQGHSEGPEGTPGVSAVHHMADMDTDTALSVEKLADALETVTLNGNLKTVGKSMKLEAEDIISAGDVCLGTLQSIDQHTQHLFADYQKVVLRSVRPTPVGDEPGADDTLPQPPGCEDAWLAYANYYVAVQQQRSAWATVMGDFGKLLAQAQELEIRRRTAVKTALQEVLQKEGELFRVVDKFKDPVMQSLADIRLTRDALDAETRELMRAHASKIVQESDGTIKTPHGKVHAEVHKVNMSPADDSFLGGLQHPLKDPLVRHAGLLEKKGALGFKWHPLLAVLTWDLYLHLFELPDSAKTQADLDPVATFNGIVPKVEKPGEQFASKKKEAKAEVLPVTSTDLINSRVSPDPDDEHHLRFDIIEERKTTGIKAVFVDTALKDVNVRAPSQPSMEKWVAKIKAITEGGLERDVDELTAAAGGAGASAPHTTPL